MKIQFLKDFDIIQKKIGDIVELDESNLDRFEGDHDSVRLCINEQYHIFKIGSEVSLILKKTSEQYLIELHAQLKQAAKRWCTDCIDDSEEILMEYPDFIQGTISEIEQILDLPRSNLQIVSATYGNGALSKDVKSIIESHVNYNSINMKIDNYSMQGDPAPGLVKMLELVYVIQSAKKTVIVKESEYLKIKGE